MDLENFKGTMSKLDLGLFVTRRMRLASLVDSNVSNLLLKITGLARLDPNNRLRGSH